MKVIRYWLPVAFVVSLIFYLSSLPAHEVPESWFPYQDKVQHIIAYTCLGFVFARALSWKFRNNPQGKPFKNALYISIFMSTAYGALDEFHQSFTPGRSVEFADFLADSVGSIIGAILVIPYRRWIAKKSESRPPDIS